MKKFILSCLLVLSSLVGWSQSNAVVTVIPDENFVATQFWGQNSLIYVVSTRELRSLTQNWSSGTAFNTVTSDIAHSEDLSTRSVTELSDVTSAGSGAIITVAERTKLTGIATGAEVNVQSNWTETNTASDAFILNKPTVFDTEAVQDIIGAMVTGNTQTGIEVTYIDGTGKINFVVTSMLAPPSIPTFNIQGQSQTVLPGTTISGTLTFNYEVINPASVSGNLTIRQAGAVLSSAVSPTGTSIALPVNNVTLTNAGDNVSFEISGVDLTSAAFSQTFVVTARSQSEFLYFGLSQDSNPVNYDIQSGGSVEITGSGQTGTITIGPTALNDHIIILAPTDHDLISLVNTGHNQDVLGNSYTKTVNVRTIDGQTYNSFVYNFPTNANFTVEYRYTLQ